MGNHLLRPPVVCHLSSVVCLLESNFSPQHQFVPVFLESGIQQAVDQGIFGSQAVIDLMYLNPILFSKWVG